MAEFYITAFGKFQDVDENPTELLLEELKEELSAKGSAEFCRLGGTKVLPVAAKQVKEWLETEFYPGLLQPGKTKPALVIHLGVDTTGTKIKLETGAVNEASFRCPDEDGWQPQGERIVSENELTHKYTTDFPIAVLAGLLRAGGHSVEQSNDTGRFVCNWAYYLSLGLAWEARQARNIHVLFVHVPPLEVLPLPRQLAAVRMLLEEISSTVAGAPSHLDRGIEKKLDIERLPSMLRALGHSA